jgi:hypothetical protein
MALVTVGTNLKLGYDQRSLTTGTSSTINSTATGVALPFYAQFTGSITRVVLSGTVSTAVTNLDVGLMGSNAAGNLPNNTYISTPNTISLSVNSTPANYVINLTNAISVTKGTVYWLAFRPNASFTGVVSVYQNHYGIYSYMGQWRSATRIASNWIQGSVTGSNAIYGSSTRWYSLDIPSVPNTPLTTVNAVVNQEYGVSFTLGANHPAVKVKAISFMNSLTNSTTLGNPGMTTSCKIYNAAGTLLYTFNTQDSDRFSTITGSGIAYFWNTSGSDIWLEPSTKYYLMYSFTGTFTNAPQVAQFIFDPATESAAGAFTAYYANRSSGGSITETNTLTMAFAVEVDGIRFNDSGGVGGYVNASPMFSGGFSG